MEFVFGLYLIWGPHLFGDLLSISLGILLIITGLVKIFYSQLSTIEGSSLAPARHLLGGIEQFIIAAVIMSQLNFDLFALLLAGVLFTAGIFSIIYALQLACEGKAMRNIKTARHFFSGASRVLFGFLLMFGFHIFGYPVSILIGALFTLVGIITTVYALGWEIYDISSY